MKRIVGLICLAGLLISAKAQSATVTVGWTLSVATGITNQTIYWGTSSGVYTNSLNLSPLATSVQITNLVQDTPYFFALTCTDAKGFTSFKSQELGWTALPVPPTGLRIIGP